MLVELRDVEVHIEPETVLTQALQDGDISIGTVIYECISEDGVESVLDGIDNDDIRDYVEKYHLDAEIDSYEHIIRAIKELPQSQKAQLLWHLVKLEEN